MNSQTQDSGSQRQVPPPWHLPQGLLPGSGRSHTCLGSGSSSQGRQGGQEPLVWVLLHA